MSEQIFTWEGISLRSYWGGNWGSSTADVAFDQIRNTGASSVAIIPNFYMQDKYSNTMGLVQYRSETIEQTRAAMLDVTSRGMRNMSATNGERIAIAAHREHGQVGISRLDTRRDRQGASMHGVKTIRLDEDRQARRAADAGYDHGFGRVHIERSERLVQAGEDGKVAAARAPNRLGIGFIIFS